MERQCHAIETELMNIPEYWLFERGRMPLKLTYKRQLTVHVSGQTNRFFVEFPENDILL